MLQNLSNDARQRTNTKEKKEMKKKIGMNLHIAVQFEAKHHCHINIRRCGIIAKDSTTKWIYIYNKL